jgi:hypothetical protein
MRFRDGWRRGIILSGLLLALAMVIAAVALVRPAPFLWMPLLALPLVAASAMLVDLQFTSVLVLLFLYAGYIALAGAFDDPRRGSRAAAILALVDACKRAGDRPICVVPHAAHPEEAAVCRIASDEIEVSDLFEYQPTDTTRRRLSITLPLTAIVQ